MMVQKTGRKDGDVQNCEHHSDLAGHVNAPSFGKRLREERERLGFSQAQFAEAGGVGRTTQHTYETDIRKPDLSYLERLRGIGVDYHYLVLGSRQVAHGSDTLAVSCSALISIYRIVDEFCRDEDGVALPLEIRIRFFQFLFASLKDKSSQDQSLDSLRNELRRLTGT